MGQIADVADQRKREALAAGAEAGKAGVAAYEAAQAGLEAQRTAAVERGHAIASKVGVTGEQQADLDAMVNTPLSQSAGALASSRAMFEGHRASADAANSAYFDKLASVEPLLEAQAAAAGGGGSGGGGGGGRGGGGGGGGDGGLGDLTDAQLGNYLMNQAVDQRKGQIATVVDKRDTASKARKQVGKQRKQNRQALKGQGRLGRQALRANPQKFERKQAKAERRLQRVDTRIDAVRAGTATGDLGALRDRRHDIGARVRRIDTVAERARTQHDLRQKSKYLMGQIGGFDAQYRDLIPTGGGRSLSQDALQIADDLGVDPILAEALVGPTKDAQYGRALAWDEKASIPDVYADAAALRVRPVAVQQMLRTPEWHDLETNTQNALAAGLSSEQNEAALQAALFDPMRAATTKGELRKAKEIAAIPVDQRRLMYALVIRRFGPMFQSLTEQKRIADADAASNGYG